MQITLKKLSNDQQFINSVQNFSIKVYVYDAKVHTSHFAITTIALGSWETSCKNESYCTKFFKKTFFKASKFYWKLKLISETSTIPDINSNYYVLYIPFFTYAVQKQLRINTKLFVILY